MNSSCAYLINEHACTEDPKVLHVRPAPDHLHSLELSSAVHTIVKDDLDQVGPPHHLGGVHQVSAEQTGHTIANALGSNDENKGSDNADAVVEEKIGGGQDVDGICGSSSSRDRDSD